jgi:hypothetical protein
VFGAVGDSGLGRVSPRTSTSVRSRSAAARSAGEYDDPSLPPGHEVCARRHGGDLVSLQQRQMPGHADQFGRPVMVQQLGAHTAIRRASARQSSWTLTH